MPDPGDTAAAKPNSKTTGTNVAAELAAGAGNKTLGKQAGSDPCANGGQGNGAATSRGGAGQSSGVFNGVNPQLSSDLQKGAAEWNAAHADTGLRAVPFSGVGSRSVGTSKHPSGNAVDYVIVDKNGCALNNLYNGDTPAYRAYESLASQMCQSSNGRVGWGGNFGGRYYHDTMHFQSGGPVGSRGRVCEGKANPYIPNNSDPSNARYDGPTDCQSANAGKGESRGDGSGGGGGGGCGEGSGGGCKPVSSAAPAAASSMMAGQGLAANSIMGAALGGFGALGSNPMAAIQGVAQQALGTALGGVLPNGAGALLSGGGIGSILSGGLANPLSQITTQIGGLVQNLGGSILPSLTGVVPSLLQGGDISGLMTGVIQNQISSLIGAGLPNLGGFGEVFSTALGAAASGADLKGALLGSVSQVFGNASSGALGSLNLPGYDITSQLPSLGITDESAQEGIADNINFVQTTLKPSIDSKKNLLLPYPDALNQIFEKPQFNGFTTMYNDYNSMITQGFGNLSNNLRALGTDLIKLGKMGDLTDLLNIGTPGQLTRQVIENGHGITSGLTSKLVDQGLTINDLNVEENSNLLYDILTEINDPYVLQTIKESFEINEDVEITSLADLLDPTIIFAESYDFNNFENLRDIALTLSICGGAGRLRNLNELGIIIAGLETAEAYTELLDEKQPIRIDEFIQLENSMPTDSLFGREGPTVADFIGSIAGYVHNETLPRMDELLQQLYDDPVTDDFYDLMALLSDTLSNPTIVNVLGIDYVRVPSVSVYTFGDYLTLDDATADIVDAIEYDLDFIKTLSESDPALEALLYEVEALHYRSAEFLAHEQRMRSKYGIDFGDPNKVNNFKGDGTTVNFPVYGTLRSSLDVSINGIQQVQGVSYTYNQNSSQITFASPPATSSVITIKYEVDSIKPQSRVTDIWQLATSLETLALETGHGKPADFLSRLITNDYHGQRIMSVMIQSRNIQRLSNYGISCPGFGQMLTDGSNIDKTVNFIDHTGIWTNNPSRASEIWIQNATDKSLDSYILERFKLNKFNIQNDLDVLMQNITRQLIFYTDGNLVISDLMAEFYLNNQNNEIYSRDVKDLIISYSDELPTEGYILGPYKEIASAIIDKENLNNDIFNLKLSSSTEEYLKSINVSLSLLVTILQRILTASGSVYLGTSEDDFQGIFGIQSASKPLLQNMANNY
jgi:hypothetical protein